MSSFLSLDQSLKRIKLKSFELESEVVFEYFNKLPAVDRDDQFKRSIYIGTLALMEDRLSAFLAKTSNELGTELESLKRIFDMKQELFFKTTVKGTMAEEDVANFLNQFFEDRKMKDKAYLTGNEAGQLPRNKTGDLICHIEDDESRKIALECKFDKSIKLGDIAGKDVFTRKSDTAWSQLIEAQANRGSNVAIIVFDRSLVDGSILKFTEHVNFIPSVGFVCIIDSQKADYSNLAIAYMLARDIILQAREVEMDHHTLNILLERIIKSIDEFLSIKKLVTTNIANNQKILEQLEKGMLLMEANQEYLQQFLKRGKLSKEELLDFYQGKGLKEKLGT